MEGRFLTTPQKLCALLVLSAACTGCQVLGRSNDQSLVAVNYPLPDQVTTEVVVNLRKPVVFYRADLALSSVARDYMYLGPVETDNSGLRELSLWVGLASTIDRDYIREAAPLGDELLLTLDSTTLRLPLIPWIHDAKHSPFPTATPLTLALRAPVSQQQIQQIAMAQNITIELLSPENPPRQYQHWQGEWLAWEAIDQDTQVGFAVRVEKRAPQPQLD